MELRQRLYNIDDVWRLAHHPDIDSRRFTLEALLIFE